MYAYIGALDLENKASLIEDLAYTKSNINKINSYTSDIELSLSEVIILLKKAIKKG